MKLILLLSFLLTYISLSQNMYAQSPSTDCRDLLLNPNVQKKLSFAMKHRWPAEYFAAQTNPNQLATLVLTGNISSLDLDDDTKALTLSDNRMLVYGKQLALLKIIEKADIKNAEFLNEATLTPLERSMMVSIVMSELQTQNNITPSKVEFISRQDTSSLILIKVSQVDEMHRVPSAFMGIATHTLLESRKD